MLVRAVANAARSLDCAGRRVLVAVSGGVDSTVLLWALHELSPRLWFNLLIGHVNHTLRGAQAEADAAFVARLGRRLGHPVRIESVDPRRPREGRSSRDRPTLQEAARRLRYEALRDMAQTLRADRIATAHTADDQAETVLLRLLRGTGPEGLGGIPERSPDGVIVRPLLRVPREAVLAFARERRLEWCEDASNADPRFARNRLRARWLPGLAAEFNPRLLRALGDLAEAQRRESEWLNRLVEQEAAVRFSATAPGTLRIRPEGWDALPEALARRLARRALSHCGAARHVSRVHLERVLDFLRSAQRESFIELPGGLTLAREPGDFRLGPAPSRRSPTRAKLRWGRGISASSGEGGRSDARPGGEESS
jgi:tRNA(Ile)-lysidine synthase